MEVVARPVRIVVRFCLTLETDFSILSSQSSSISSVDSNAAMNRGVESLGVMIAAGAEEIARDAVGANASDKEADAMTRRAAEITFIFN